MAKLNKAQEKRFDEMWSKVRKIVVENGIPLVVVHPDKAEKKAKQHLIEELDIQRKEIIEKLRERKENLMKPGGFIPVTNVKTFDLDSFKDGLDQAIKAIK